MASKRRSDHATKLCASVEKLAANPVIRLGDLAIIYRAAGHHDDARALMELRNDIEQAVDQFKREATDRYL